MSMSYGFINQSTYFINILFCTECTLLGHGPCRGEKWNANGWPKTLKGKWTVDHCCHECSSHPDCTGFSFEATACTLYANKNIEPGQGRRKASGNCYKIIGKHELHNCKIGLHS